MESGEKIHAAPEAASKNFDKLSNRYAVFGSLIARVDTKRARLIKKENLPVHIVSHVGPTGSQKS